MPRITVLFLLLVYLPAVTAVERNNFGKGQVLLFPFFNAENGWNTLINVTLPPFFLGHILKVRVLDGEDGVAVNTFNVYAQSHQNWRAAIIQDNEGQAFLQVAEGACTISESGQSGGPGTEFPLAARTGMLEVYQVSYYVRIIGQELECEELAERWQSGGAWTIDPLRDLQPQNTEIVGHFDLVQVEQGLSAEHSATGLKDFTGTIPHTAPGDVESPSLADADPMATLSSGVEVEPDSGEGIDAIALLLATRDGTMTNDVVIAPSIGANTDWIVSFPLRGYERYGDHEFEIDGVDRTCNANTLTNGGQGILRRLTDSPWIGWGGGVRFGQIFSDITPDPVLPYSLFLCYSVNVLAFEDQSPTLLPEDSKLFTPVALSSAPLPPSVTLRYTFSDGLSEPDKNDGRPVLAFRATTFANGTLNNGAVLANYMILKSHLVE